MKIVRIENDYGYRVLLQGAFNTGARLVRKLMADDYVILPFVLDTPIEFRLGDWLVFEEGEEDFGRYELVSKYKPTYDTLTATYRYELKLEAHYMKWKNKKLKYNPQTGGSELSFSLTSSIGTHAAIIIDNLRHLGYTYWDDDSAFVVSFDSSIDLAKTKVVSYDNISILDALTSIAKAFECEWWVTENIIHFGKCQSEGGEEVEFILGDNISDMTKSDSGQDYATQLYIFGSDRNLPRSYKKSDSDDLTKTAIVQRRLMLPTHAELEAVIASDPSYADLPTLLSDHGYSLDDRGFIRVLGLRQEQLVEGVYVNDEVYPKTACVVSDIDTYEQDVEEEDNEGNITTTHYTYYRVKDGSGFDFDSDMILEGQTLHINFTSGSLNGMDFECEFKKSGEDFAPYYEIVGNESYGRFLPDEHLYPRIGDTFALYNWDATKLTETGLIPKASCDLLRKAIEYLDKSKIDPNQYTCTEECYESNYFIRDLGERVRLVNAAYFPEGGRSSRIIGMEVNLDMPYDHPKYTVAEKADYIYQSHVENTEELTFNGQSYTGKSIGGGQSIYLIKLNDSTRPSDSNTFSAKRIINDFLSAINDDTANGIIRFLQGLQIGSGDYGIDGNGNANLLSAILRSLTGQSYTGPDIIGDKGFRLWQDEDGLSNLIVDKLTVRLKAFFAELEIRKVSFTGGDLFFSSAGSKVFRVSPVDGDGNVLLPTYTVLHLVSANGMFLSANGKFYAIKTTEEYTDAELLARTKAFRCYEYSDDGTTQTMNYWQVGDMARCQTFNIDEGGKYEGATNRYYGRLAVRTGREVLEDGLTYNYVDLSNVGEVVIDGETLSGMDDRMGIVNDIPMAGDHIAQVGSQVDTTRQGIIELALHDGGSINVYSGVDDWDMSDKRIIHEGADGFIIHSERFLLTTGGVNESIAEVVYGRAIKTDSTLVCVQADANGSISAISQVQGLPSYIAVDDLGVPVPVSDWELCVVNGATIYGHGPASISQWVDPTGTVDSGGKRINLTWAVGQNYFRSFAMNIRVVYSKDGETRTLTRSLPVAVSKDGQDGTSVPITVMLTPSSLVVEEVLDMTTNPWTRRYDYSNAYCDVVVRAGDTLQQVTISTVAVPTVQVGGQQVPVCEATINGNRVSLSSFADGWKDAILTIEATTATASYSLHLHVYVNRLGTFESQVVGDVSQTLATRDITYIDETTGQSVTIPSLSTIYQDAMSVVVGADTIAFKSGDGSVTYMTMNVVRDPQDPTHIIGYTVNAANMNIDDLTGRNLTITGNSSFSGVLNGATGSFHSITTPNGTFAIDENGTASFSAMRVSGTALLGSAVFKDSYMYSQQGRIGASNIETGNYGSFDPEDPDSILKWKPNFYVNFLTGKVRLVNADIIGNIRQQPLHVRSSNFSSIYYLASGNTQRYYGRYGVMPEQSLQLDYLPSDHDTVVCDAELASYIEAFAPVEGLTVTVINVSGRSYLYKEIDNWNAPTFKYSSIGNKTIAQFQLLLFDHDNGYMVVPALLSLRDI